MSKNIFQITTLLILALCIASCSKKSTVVLTKPKAALALKAKVAFLDKNQILPQITTKVGELPISEILKKSKCDEYAAIQAAKIIARENGANLLKVVVDSSKLDNKTCAHVIFEFHHYEGNLGLLEKIKVNTPVEKLDPAFKIYAHLKECSQTSNNLTRKWCSNLSIRRAVIQNYDFPTVTDSSTFEKQEIYVVAIKINADGVVSETSVSGGTNEVVKKGIDKALLKANLTFLPAVSSSTGKSINFTYEVNVRAFDLMSPNQGPSDDDHSQTPIEAAEEELEYSKRQGGVR
jgi:hypothetical protein